jgi:hypothetical protein
MYWGISWKENTLFKHSPVVGGVHGGTMDNANSSPSVRTGHINEVCGNSLQEIGGMGIDHTG